MSYDINYYHDSYPYSPTQYHLPGVPLRIFGDMSDVDQINLKVQLRNRLNSAQLLNMPAGFPFRFIFDGHGGSYGNKDSFEFREEFLVSSQNERPRYQSATIAYTKAGPKDDYSSWRIFFPSRDPSYCRIPTGKFAVAHVKVENSVLRTVYGRILTRNPSIVLRALSMSLELGMQITLRLAESPVPLPRSSKYPSMALRKDTVIYIGQYNDGKEEILSVVDQPPVRNV